MIRSSASSPISSCHALFLRVPLKGTRRAGIEKKVFKRILRGEKVFLICRLTTAARPVRCACGSFPVPRYHRPVRPVSLVRSDGRAAACEIPALRQCRWPSPHPRGKARRRETPHPPLPAAIPGPRYGRFVTAVAGNCSGLALSLCRAAVLSSRRRRGGPRRTFSSEHCG